MSESPVAKALRERRRARREETERILFRLAEMAGQSAPVALYGDWDVITYYDLKYVGVGFKEIEFLMMVKMNIAATGGRYEPTLGEIKKLREIEEKVVKSVE